MAREAVTFANPSVVAPPLGSYSHVSKGAGLLHIAGQVGVDAHGDVAGDEVRSQARQTYRNLEAILSSEGLSSAAILKFTTYLVDEDDIAAFYGVRDELFPELFPDGAYPPNTLLVVRRLVKPEFRVEIEAVAALSEAQ